MVLTALGESSPSGGVVHSAALCQPFARAVPSVERPTEARHAQRNSTKTCTVHVTAIVASELLSEDLGWEPVPKNHVGIVREDRTAQAWPLAGGSA